MKTQKKVADVVSPLSISNSFASLTVEDAEDECTVDTVPTSVTTIRKSREGPNVEDAKYVDRQLCQIDKYVNGLYRGNLRPYLV